MPGLQTGEEGEEELATFKCKLYRCADWRRTTTGAPHDMRAGSTFAAALKPAIPAEIAMER